VNVVVGVLRERFPYVRIGTGRQPLVILPGLTLENRPASGLVAWTYGQAFRQLADEYTLFIVQRPRGLPANIDTRQLAADYAQLIHEDIGRARLMGLSTGGLIAQYVGLNNPELIERLVLVVTGAYLAPAGREICEQWRELATRQQWRRLRGGLAAAAVDGAIGQRMAKVLGSLSGRAPAPTEAADFVATVDADLDHNATSELPQLEMPVVVIGGAEDPFFPEPVLRETAAQIPQGELRLYPDAGHGLPKKHSKQLQQDVLGFLADQS
jgi:pimeloyl-ACP methyl ester carboxylesterase